MANAIPEPMTDAGTVARVDLVGRALVVYNPGSGGAGEAPVLDELNRRLGFDRRRFEVHVLERGADLTALIRAAREAGVGTIIAAGGDGTVSAVGASLVGTEIRLGIIPLGTANVLARELGIPLDLEDACRVLTGPHRDVALDALRVGEGHYFTQVGIGIDALMIRDTTEERKRRFGRLAYLWSAGVRLLGFEPIRFSIAVDDVRLRPRATQVVLANCGAMGSPGLRWGENVRADDGRVDVCIVHARNLLDYAHVALSVAFGRHRRERRITYLEATRTIAVNADRPLPVQADGEIIGGTPIEVAVVPHALRVIVPDAEADADASGGSHSR